MTKVHKNRLRKLANHLLTGERYHKKFNFRSYASTDEHNRRCGSAGCALGECPTVFPRTWGWPCHNVPGLLRGECDPHVAAQAFFGLSSEDALALFYSHVRSAKVEPLPDTATRTQVARRILKFVEAQ